MAESKLVSISSKVGRHTMLFDQSLWLISGVYINEKSVSVNVEGECQIVHRDGRWFNELSLELKLEDNREYRNLQYKTLYEYSPVESVQETSTWHAFNALLGRLQGILVFVDDTIISSYQNLGGNMRGAETFRMVSEFEYQCRGALFEANKRSSSWALRYDRG